MILIRQDPNKSSVPLTYNTIIALNIPGDIEIWLLTGHSARYFKGRIHSTEYTGMEAILTVVPIGEGVMGELDEEIMRETYGYSSAPYAVLNIVDGDYV